MIGSDEYDLHVGRGGKDYSFGHQQLYRFLIELLRQKPAKVFEVGPGIGFGLRELLKANAVSQYVGVEESQKCCDWLHTQFPGFQVECSGFNEFDIFRWKGWADFTLCIEVIEHVEGGPADLHKFMVKLYEVTRPGGILLFTTMDRQVNAHGRYTKAELRGMLEISGFSQYVEIEWQLPHVLYLAQRPHVEPNQKAAT